MYNAISQDIYAIKSRLRSIRGDVAKELKDQKKGRRAVGCYSLGMPQAFSHEFTEAALPCSGKANGAIPLHAVLLGH